MKAAKKTAYSYIRFSTPDQAKGDSLRRQRETSEAYCERHDLLLDDSLRDCGVSGFRGKNRKSGALSRFLDAVQGGQVRSGSVLIVESLDRLSREEIDTAREAIRQILRAGVDIVTLSPERRYTKDTLNDAFGLLEIIVIAQRANEESKIKSERVGRAWQSKRERIVNGEKLTKHCPSWLKLSADRKAFVVLPDKAAVVRKIFDLAIGGMGCKAIARRLNIEGVPVLHKATWNSGLISNQILRNPAVYGVFISARQAHSGRDRQAGKPVDGYYPAVVSQETFEAAGRAMSKRKLNCNSNRREEKQCPKCKETIPAFSRQCPKCKEILTVKAEPKRARNAVANLFTGLLVDVRDGQKMHLSVRDAHNKALVSAGAKFGKKGSVHITLPYQWFEVAVLELLSGLTPADILPANSKPSNVQAEFTAAQERLSAVENKIEKIKTRLLGEADIDTLVEALTALDAQRKTFVAEIERLRGELVEANGSPLDGTQSLAALLAGAEGSDLFDLRSRLRAKLSQLIAGVQVFVERETHLRRAALMQVNFKAGGSRVMFLRCSLKGLAAMYTLDKGRAVDMSAVACQRLIAQLQATGGDLTALQGRQWGVAATATTVSQAAELRAVLDRHKKTAA